MVFDVDKLDEVLDNRQFDDDDDGDLEVVLDAARMVVAGQPLWWCVVHGRASGSGVCWDGPSFAPDIGCRRMVEGWWMPTGGGE